MACFVVPAGEAIVTTIATKVISKDEKRQEVVQKLHRLNGLLWGGSVLLAFEHVWHGEVQPFFPFLTAAESPEQWAEMVTEVSTVGVAMAVVITAVWAGSIVVTDMLKRRREKVVTKANA